MHVFAGRDRLGGVADDLAELAHRLPAGNRLDGDLVPLGDRLRGAHIAEHRLAGGDVADGHDHRVDGIEAQDCRSVENVHHGNL
jgi:hypothetical protein